MAELYGYIVCTPARLALAVTTSKSLVFISIIDPHLSGSHLSGFQEPEKREVLLK